MIITTKGYVLKKQDYNDFDEIITIINEHGNKFVFLSLGSRKITSKNAYNLDYGNFIEFEFFFSEEKMSRLKKANTLSTLENSYKMNISLFFLNELFSKVELGKITWYKIYQKVIFYIVKMVNDYYVILYLCIQTYKLLGLSINFNSCYKCQTTYHIKTIDFSHFQVVCKACYDITKQQHYNIKVLNLIFQLQREEIDLLDVKDIAINDLIKIIKAIIFFMYNNVGIYLETFGWL